MVTEENKEKIIWLRKLLKEISPKFFKYYASYKIKKYGQKVQPAEPERLPKV
jgi:hypothetical protein